MSAENVEIVKYWCPQCGKKLSAPREAIGKKGVCPGCRAEFVVPQGGATRPPRPSTQAK